MAVILKPCLDTKICGSSWEYSTNLTGRSKSVVSWAHFWCHSAQALPRNSLVIGSYNAPAALLGDFLGLDKLPKNPGISKTDGYFEDRTTPLLYRFIHPSIGGSLGILRELSFSKLQCTMYVSSEDFCWGKQNFEPMQKPKTNDTSSCDTVIQWSYHVWYISGSQQRLQLGIQPFPTGCNKVQAVRGNTVLQSDQEEADFF